VLRENGDFLWAGHFGQTGEDEALSIDYADQSLFIGGLFEGLDADLAPGIKTVLFDNINNGKDGCLIRINAPECDVSPTEELVVICSGDSAFIAGAWTTVQGLYIDSLQTTLGCDSLVFIQLNIFNPINLTFTTEQANCSQTGSAIVAASGIAPIGFQRNDALQTTGCSLLNVSPGEYMVTVIDGNGCTTSAAIAVTSLWSGCPGDFDLDGCVGVSDMLEFIASFGCSSGCCPIDIDGDDQVGIADLLLLLNNYSAACN